MNFGDTRDRSIGLGIASITASIASFTILGQVFDSTDPVSTSDHFGFVAERIGLFSAGGFVAHLTAGQANHVIELSPITGDVTMGVTRLPLSLFGADLTQPSQTER